ncbi:DUF2256 domain-containing protein [Acidithiobacillus caldus]
MVGSAVVHKGNKQSLPTKICAHCGRPMTWRRAWARCWDEVRYCSEACRRRARQGRAETLPSGKR